MKVAIVYESTRGRTLAMAKAFCEGVESASMECNLIDAKDFEGIQDACAIAVGSSTRMKRPLPHVRRVLSELSNLSELPAASFGSYGWSGEAPDEIASLLEKSGAALVDSQPIKAKDYPSEEILESCKRLGRALAERCSK
ncbi:MAG: FprA family A-type flavoprotein [Candidatus Thorarchaeota archaeon]|nr:MAG: FprA family A-type flavoprotein [Candidatus Thorarchaeota archaeon]